MHAFCLERSHSFLGILVIFSILMKLLAENFYPDWESKACDVFDIVLTAFLVSAMITLGIAVFSVAGSF